MWLPGAGWSRVDPTAAVAPNRIARGAMDALSAPRHMFDYQWLRNVKNGFDLLQRGWNDWVIAFDSERQMSLFMPFGIGHLDSRRMVAIMVVVIGIIALLMLPRILRLRLNVGVDAAGKQWILFRQKLRAAGVESSAAMTPKELHLVAASHFQDQSGNIGKISSLYRNIRYAPDRPEVSELEAAVKEFNPARNTR